MRDTFEAKGLRPLSHSTFLTEDEVSAIQHAQSAQLLRSMLASVVIGFLTGFGLAAIVL